MKTIFSFLVLFLALGWSNANAHVHGELFNHGNNYYNYYHTDYAHHKDADDVGHSHHVTAANPNLRHWYHSHDGTHHFHDISNGHTDHTRPYRNYVSYRPYEYADDYDWDHKKVWGQSYPGRPSMGYSRNTNTVKTCNCSRYRRY